MPYALLCNLIEC